MAAGFLSGKTIMKKNNINKVHFRLYFNYLFSYKTYAALKIFSEVFNEMFSEFKTRYDYIKWRRSINGGFHPSFLKTKDGQIVYYIDFVSLKCKMLDFDTLWYEEIISLLFDESVFLLDENAFENAKQKYLTYMNNCFCNASYQSVKYLYSKSFLEDKFCFFFPDNVEIIENLRIEDIKNIFLTLKDHLFYVSSFNLDEKELRCIKDKLPKYSEKKIPYVRFDVDKFNKALRKQDCLIENNNYSLLFKLDSFNDVFVFDLFFYYLRGTKSAFFEVLREKYGLIYAYNLIYERHYNFFSIDFTIDEKQIGIVDNVINDFLSFPKKYFSLEKFKTIKNEFVNLHKANMKSEEFSYLFDCNAYYDIKLLNTNEYFASIKRIKYTDIIDFIKGISYVGNCFLSELKK